MGCEASHNNLKNKQSVIRKRTISNRKAGQGKAGGGPAQEEFVAEDGRQLTKEEMQKVERQRSSVAKRHKTVPVSNNFNNENIADIANSFAGLSDREVAGETPDEVILFETDRYSTHDWTPLQFAIFNQNLPAVRYLVEHKQVNARLQSRKRELERDDTVFDAEIFPLILALHNKDQAMLDYLWNLNELWDYEHLILTINIVFSRSFWLEGIKIIVGSEASQDIYNSLNYDQRKEFMQEMWYRYLAYADEIIQENVKKTLGQRPYNLVALHFLMSEQKADDIPLIKEYLENIAPEDYAKLKYESHRQFFRGWERTLESYVKLTGDFKDIAKKAEK